MIHLLHYLQTFIQTCFTCYDKKRTPLSLSSNPGGSTHLSTLPRNIKPYRKPRPIRRKLEKIPIGMLAMKKK